MIAFTVVAFIVSLRQGNKVKELRFISYYIIAALIDDLISIYLYFSYGPERGLDRSQISPETIFSYLEIAFLYIFFYHNIAGNTKRKIMLSILSFYCLFIICCGVVWHQNILNLPGLIFGLQAICLVIPPLFYFHEFFTIPSNPVLKNHPPFWIATGILLCNGGTLPIYILTVFIHTNFDYYFGVFFTVNYILYSILFLLILKAYLCVPKMT